MIKISQRDMRSKEKNDLEHIRKALKKEPIVIREFKENNRDINEIDNVSIQFMPADELGVSAKTIDGKIYLSDRMLDDSWKDYFHYAVHEIKHYIQHVSGQCNPNSTSNYLDNPNEIDAFKDQIEYREKTEGKKVVNDYLNELFNKHHLSPNERKEKKKELLGD